MQLGNYGIEVGKQADLIILQARSVQDALRLKPARLAVIRKGRVIARTPEVVSRDPAYVGLFGAATGKLSVYTHHHNHAHDLHGNVVPGDEAHREPKAPANG